MINLPSHLVPVYNVLAIYCEHTSDKQLEELLAKLKTNTITLSEMEYVTNLYEEVSSPIYRDFHKICRKFKLNYDDCLMCGDDKFVKHVQIMFTYLSFNSNIILTNCFNSYIDISVLQESMINYLLTGQDSQLPILRYSVANFVKTYRKPSLFERIFKRVR